MRRPQLSWLLFVQLIFLFSKIQNAVLVNGKCLNDQRTHLLHLKNSLSFDSSYSTKIVQWNPEEDCCSWRGVGCDASGRVTTLELDDEDISCQVHDNLTSLFRLQFLEKLNLGFNNFIDIPIPKDIANLTNLVYLNLSHSGFVGQFPSELSNLRKLVSLDLSNLNSLKLEEPTLKMVLQNLSNIEEMYLDGVELSAEKSDWFQIIATSLPKLRVLSLRANYITRPIHMSLSSTRIPNLSHIYLDGFNISTKVPEFFATLSNLTTLSLTNCNLLGRFPMKIFQVPTLQTLDISDNILLKGSFPPFPKNSSLREILIHNTNFSGSLPNSIGNLHTLSRLDLSACNFSGTIPAALPNLLQLYVIDLSENKFSGPVPLFRASKNLVYIDLSHNRLTGSLSSAHFKGLESLQTLNLGNNFLSGNLPTTLFKLPALRVVRLSNNQFSGQIDEIHDKLALSRTGLMTLDLSSNKFNESFPKLLFELKQLEELSISSNSFTDTIQLETFNNLPKLTSLDLSCNNLTVKLQSNISSLARMGMLGLGSCKLKRFPEIRSFEELYYLDLSDNGLTGEIPNWIWNLSLGHVNLSFNSFVGLQKPYEIPHLGELDLHSNQLQGEVPIPSASSAYVDYSRNNFSGPIPSLIGLKLNSTLFLSISDNSLTGSIPDSICVPTLQFLDLSNNELNGIIPSCLMTNTTRNLGVLNLAGNNLSGSIPDTFSEDCSLETLELGMNHLQGNLPRTLSKCSMLEVLNLGHNEFEDVFPCMLKNSSSLRVLILRSNKFHGDLECFGYTNSWSRLQIIDIASNSFSGILSSEFFSSLKNMLTLDITPEHSRADLVFDIYASNGLSYQFKVVVTMKGLEIELEKILTIFTYIDFSNNKFLGNIPESIGDLKALHVLDLSHNELTGRIPSSIGKLSNIESLDLSRNQLTGEIPPALQDLNFLSFLNLSFNILTGKIPTGPHFDTFSNDSYIGNVGLCGFPLNVRCGNANDSGLPSMPLLSNNKEIEWIYISTALGYTVGLGIFSLLLLFCGRWRNKLFLQVDQLLVKVLGKRRDMPREPIRRL